MTSYAVWNNKGGVGKTFLSFLLATEYANRHPKKHVVVIDMCPQASISEILLSENKEQGKNYLGLKSKGLTVGGYFRKRISFPHGSLGTESTYLIPVKEYNKNIPANLSLIVGDSSVENYVEPIDKLSTLGVPEDAWKKIFSWVIDLKAAAVRSQQGRNVLFIIDCHPSFSTYTKLALLAADRLIVPCSPDIASASAVEEISRLLFGKIQDSDFLKKTNNFFMPLPKFHMFILNKSTQHAKEPAKAFKAMEQEVKNKVEKLIASDKSHDMFSNADNPFEVMPDTHTVSVICSSLGLPMSKIKAMAPYELVDGEKTQAGASSLKSYKESFEKIIVKL